MLILLDNHRQIQIINVAFEDSMFIQGNKHIGMLMLHWNRCVTCNQTLPKDSFIQLKRFNVSQHYTLILQTR